MHNSTTILSILYILPSRQQYYRQASALCIIMSSTSTTTVSTVSNVEPLLDDLQALKETAGDDAPTHASKSKSKPTTPRSLLRILTPKYKERFKGNLTPAHVCVALVRPQRGHFQNVTSPSWRPALPRPVSSPTSLPTPEPPIRPTNPHQCSVITIAQYTRDFFNSTHGSIASQSDYQCLQWNGYHPVSENAGRGHRGPETVSV